MAYLGGAASDLATGLVVDPSGNIYVGGTTQSVDFPIVPAGATPGKTIYGGGTSDAFVTMINGASFPIASVSPQSLNFGTQNVGTASASQTVTLRNSGNGILNISSIVFAGTSGDYSQTNNCGTQLTPVGGAKDNCTITVTFTPSTVNSRPDILQILDDAANSPQTVALSGSGIVNGGTIQLSVSALAFGSQPVGSPSTSKTVTLTNSSSSAALTISSITAPNPFKQTNNCPVSPSTLAAGANCAIQVTFVPTAAGNASGILSVSAIAQNSPQSVALSGTGTSAGASGAPDFALASAQQSVSVSGAGGTATFQVSATPFNGFNQTLNVSCTVPSPANCSASPSSLAMDGTSVPSSTITVTISGSGGGTVTRSAELRHGLRGIFASMFSFGMLGLVVVGRKRKAMLVLLLVVLLGTVLITVNCGAGASHGTMAPGTYQVTVTAASSGSSSVSHSTTVSLTVN
jgi:hypothetical protein